MPAIELKHGMFAWTDLIAHDVEGAKAFYGDLFGWRPAPLPDHPASAYTLFMLGDDRVAGLTPMSDGMKAQGVPPMWVSYILVDDVDEMAARVAELGGAVMLPPMDIADSGRMALIQDPSGGSVALWEAGTHRGATRFNDPGCMAWNELLTRDPLAARPFFADLLGWSYDEMELGEQGTYHVCKVGGRPNGGIMTMPAGIPDFVPPHWDVYFAVDDVDDTASRATSLGGSLVVPPTDIAVGRFAYLADPSGGHFTVFKAN